MNISSIGIEQGHSWSNWNIAYTYDQLGKSKALNESKGPVRRTYFAAKFAA